MILIASARRIVPSLALHLLSAALISLAIILVASPPPTHAASTLIVGGGGYSTISAAVSASLNGDTIRIHAGTYREQVNVTKDITLQAYGDGQPWVDGECSRSYGVVIGVSGASVTGMGVKRTNQEGVRIDGGNDIALDAMTIQDYNCLELDQQYAAGVASWFNSSRLRITNNTITRRVQLAGSPYGFGNGIWIKNTSASTGGGHYIADNTIVGGYDGIGGEPEGVVHGAFYRDAVIERNAVSDCWDDGIQVEGGNINVAVRDNTIDGCAIGIALAPTLQGPLYIERNTIVDLAPGYYGAVYAFKLGDSSAGTVYFTGNLVTSIGDGFKQSSGGLPTMIARDNMLNVGRRVIEINDDVPSGSSFDRDCLWSSDPDRFIIWEGDDYYTVSSFRSATGQEPNGTQNSNCGTQPPADADGDGVPDAQDNCPQWVNPAQNLPPWTVPPGDADCDGFRDTVGATNKAPETYIGTDPLQHCAATAGPNNDPSPDAWPADFNDDRAINGQDTGKFGGPFGSYNKFVSDGPFGPPGHGLPGERFDFGGNGVINGQDTGQNQAYFNKVCTP